MVWLSVILSIKQRLEVLHFAGTEFSMTISKLLVSVSTVLVLALAGCGEAGYPVDTAVLAADTATDTASDADTDTGADSGSDDTAVDSGSDTGSDTDTGSGDADTDTDSDSDTDADSDTDSDTDADTDADPECVTDADCPADACYTYFCGEGICFADAEVDVDGDGYGVDCGAASGGDCDDADALVNPGATETCNEVDDDCDGAVDDGVTIREYLDQDGDGWGDELTGTDTCVIETGYVDNSQVGDCNTEDATVYPDATEIPDDGIDQDCDEADEVTDDDGDGYGISDDCDDADASVNPGAHEACDSVDNDCDGSVDEYAMIAYYADVDGDGYGDEDNMSELVCGQPSGYVLNGSDCDDGDASVYEGATEVLDDGIDQDCDGSDASLETLQAAAVCDAGQEACFRDVDDNGAYETLLMTSGQLYGFPASATVYENGAGTGCKLSGDTVPLSGSTVSANSGGFYVVSFDGMTSCTTQLTLTSGSSWWQNYVFCTDGSDTQHVCVETSPYNYLVGITWSSSTLVH